jgi:hypothetical protein
MDEGRPVDHVAQSFIREAAPGPQDTSREAVAVEAAGIDLAQATLQSDLPAAASERSVKDKLKDAAMDASDRSSMVPGLFEKAGL